MVEARWLTTNSCIHWGLLWILVLLLGGGEEAQVSIIGKYGLRKLLGDYVVELLSELGVAEWILIVSYVGITRMTRLRAKDWLKILESKRKIDSWNKTSLLMMIY